jgi:hypothetical protein
MRCASVVPVFAGTATKRLKRDEISLNHHRAVAF